MYCFAVAGGRLVQRVRSLTFSKVVYQEIGWFDDIENSSGAIAARLAADAATVRSIVGDTLSLLVQNISTIIAGTVIAFSANWKLALLILALVPLMGLQSWVQVKFMQGFAANAKGLDERFCSIALPEVKFICVRAQTSYEADARV
jgi:ATP-binding cassette subfamily B (MDR/TAP) protein 1